MAIALVIIGIVLDILDLCLHRLGQLFYHKCEYRFSQYGYGSLGRVIVNRTLTSQVTQVDVAIAGEERSH